MAVATGISNTQGDISDIPEINILEYYFGITNVPCVILSPLRIDSIPSFKVFCVDGKVTYHDFGIGCGGNIFGMLREKFCLSHGEVVKMIKKDKHNIMQANKCLINRGGKADYLAFIRKANSRTKRDLQVTIRPFEQYDLEYWASQGISKKTLEFGNVYAISYYFIPNDTGKLVCKRADKYAYVYVENKDDEQTKKVYQPFSKLAKWKNNHNSSVWDLWAQAINSDSEDLIITSSRKDALCLWENLKIASVSLQSEVTKPKKQVMDILFSRFRRVYVLYDNDYDKAVNVGRNNMQKLILAYPKLIGIEIPSEYKAKDPSDLFKKHGKTIMTNLILKQMKDEV